jgi:hypothetical protein
MYAQLMTLSGLGAESKRRWYSAVPKARERARNAAWRAANRAWLKARYPIYGPKQRARQKRNVANLIDGYVLKLLGLSASSNVPRSLIEAKRAHLALVRMLKRR